MTDLNLLLNPKSIAVIGASRDEKKLGTIVIRNILDSKFGGKVYPVNPKASSVYNLQCYSSISELPEIPDLTIISLPSKLVLDLVRDTNNKGCKNLLVFSAGFKEIGDEGIRLENELKDYCEKNNINLLGPNCLGFANTLTPINATFGKATLIKGNLRFVSQSGAVASAIFDWASSISLGFSEFVTLGNKTVVNETSILKHWKKNSFEKFAPIGMYLESIVNGKSFMEVTKKISIDHPVFVLKPGKSVAAQKAMQSHTGAIAGADHVLNQAFRQCGIIRCHDIQDMFDLSMFFSWSHITSGSNVAVISNAGGPAVISTDLVSEHNLNLAKLSDKTHDILEKYLPRAASLLNPIDVLGDALADRYEVALSAVLEEDSVDSVLVILTPQIMTQIEQTAKIIGKLSKLHKKPVLCAFVGGTQVLAGEKVLSEEEVPYYRFPERAIKVLSSMYQWQTWVKKEKAKHSTSSINSIENPSLGDFEKHFREAKTAGNSALDILDSNSLLKELQINVPKLEKVDSFDQALTFSQKAHFPCVLKLSSPDLLHKKDVGGVIVNINSYKSLVDSYKKMSALNLGDIVIQKQVEVGVELIVGIKRDSIFGNVLMFGAGGTLAELIQDRNLIVAPLTRDMIIELISSSKIYPILQGYRGGMSYDLEPLYALIYKMYLFMEQSEEVTEFEINPVILNKNGVWAVDGKVLF